MTDLLLACRWILAIVLVSAGATKVVSRRGELAAAIRNYGLLPELFIRPFAVVLPGLEVVLGFLLAVGVALVPVAGTAAALLGVFAAAIGWHLSHGHRVPCGCGGGGDIHWRLFARDLTLSVAAVAVSLGPSGGLAVWPGWAAGHVSASWRSLIPVPLAVLLMTAMTRLLVAGAPLLRIRVMAPRLQPPVS